MNIDQVYFCHIYLKTSKELKYDSPIKKPTHTYTIPIKKTLVIKNKIFPREYNDLFTGEIYRDTPEENIHIGELFIEKTHGLIPYKKIIKVKKDNLSKRRILLKYKRYLKETNT